MANAFTLFGEIKADTKQFTKALREADSSLKQTEKAISSTENKSESLGRATNLTARQFDKLKQSAQESKQTLGLAAAAFSRGEISAAKMRSVMLSFERTQARVNSRLADMNARLGDAAKKSVSFTSKMGIASAAGNLAADAFQRAASKLYDLGQEGAAAFRSLDKLTRATATLDKNFQSTEALDSLRKGFSQLSAEIPQTAENIAKASFTVKSAYADLNQSQLTDFLRELGIAATASNTTIDAHADRITALAKSYGVTAKDINKFSALVSTAFGDALSSDSEVGGGFNKILIAAKNLKQPLEDVTSAMAAIHSTSNDAERSTNNLVNVYSKLADPKIAEGLKEVFNINAFDATGQFKGLNEIVNELAASLKGLSDEDRLAKIGKVFKDQQAREGILALIGSLDTYNNRLKNGADQDAWLGKTKVMLNSADAQWTIFWNKVLAQQTAFGQQFTTQIGSIVGQQTTGGGFEALFVNLGANITSGFTSLAKTWKLALFDFESMIREWTGSDPGMLANRRAEIQKYYDNEFVEIENQRKSRLNDIKQGQIDWYKKILASPIASPEVKAETQKALASLGEEIKKSAKVFGPNIADSINSTKPALSQAGKEAGKAIVDSYLLSLNQLGKKTLATDALVQNLIKDLQAADPKIRAQAQASAQALVDTINKQLEAAKLNPASAGLIQSLAQLLESLNKALQSSAPTLEKSSAIIGKSIGEGFMQGIQSTQGAVKNAVITLVSNSVGGAKNYAMQAGYSIGSSVSAGMANGINAGKGSVAAAAFSLGTGAADSTRNAIQSASPSKVFHGIGQDVVLGFVDGINSLKYAGHQAMLDLLKIPSLAGLGKESAKGIEFLGNLAGELANLGAKTKETQVALELTKAAYAGLNPQVRESIELTARQIDLQNQLVSGTDKLNSAIDNLRDGLIPAQTELEKLNDLFKDKEVLLALNDQAAAVGKTASALKGYLQVLAGIKDSAGVMPSNAGTGMSGNGGSGISSPTVPIFADLGVPPELPKAWDNFFATLSARMESFKASLPSMKQALGENLGLAISDIGHIFGNAVQQWDGTLRGFFSSIAQGFGDMARQIIADLVRLLMYKAIMRFVGAFAGGGSFGGGGDFGGAGAGGSYASGGFVSGRGSSTSDSIPAMLSNGEYVVKAGAVKAFGAGFFESLNNLQFPAFAGGGFVSPMPVMPSTGTTNNSTQSNNYHITMNVSTNDANSFKKSENQIVGELYQKIRSKELRNR